MRREHRKQPVFTVVFGRDVREQKPVHTIQRDAVPLEPANRDVGQHESIGRSGDRDASLLIAWVLDDHQPTADQRDPGLVDGERFVICAGLDADDRAGVGSVDGLLNRATGGNHDIRMADAIGRDGRNGDPIGVACRDDRDKSE